MVRTRSYCLLFLMLVVLGFGGESFGVVIEEDKGKGEAVKELKILAWNIWGRMNQDPRYTVKGKTGRDRTIEILKDTGADIIVMVETYGSAKDIAEGLGYHYYTPSGGANLCIFSRYKLSDVGTPKGLSSFSFIHATAHVRDDLKVRVHGIWLTSGGRHIFEITNKKVSDEAFTNEDDRRYDHLQQLLKHPVYLADLKRSKEVPLVIAGDFNCVSHLDYTKKTKKAGLNFGRVLRIKASMAMAKAEFVDSYRKAHPEVTKETLGYTWTTVGQGYKYVSGKGFVKIEGKYAYDGYREMFSRIDYIYHRGNKLKVKASEVVKHYKDIKGRSFVEFPSDHAGVLTRYKIK